MTTKWRCVREKNFRRNTRQVSLVQTTTMREKAKRNPSVGERKKRIISYLRTFKLQIVNDNLSFLLCLVEAPARRMQCLGEFFRFVGEGNEHTKVSYAKHARNERVRHKQSIRFNRCTLYLNMTGSCEEGATSSSGNVTCKWCIVQEIHAEDKCLSEWVNDWSTTSTCFNWWERGTKEREWRTPSAFSENLTLVMASIHWQVAMCWCGRFAKCDGRASNTGWHAVWCDDGASAHTRVCVKRKTFDVHNCETFKKFRIIYFPENNSKDMRRRRQLEGRWWWRRGRWYYTGKNVPRTSAH